MCLIPCVCRASAEVPKASALRRTEALALLPLFRVSQSPAPMPFPDPPLNPARSGLLGGGLLGGSAGGFVSLLLPWFSLSCSANDRRRSLTPGGSGIRPHPPGGPVAPSDAPPLRLQPPARLARAHRGLPLKALRVRRAAARPQQPAGRRRGGARRRPAALLRVIGLGALLGSSGAAEADQTRRTSTGTPPGSRLHRAPEGHSGRPVRDRGIVDRVHG